MTEILLLCVWPRGVFFARGAVWYYALCILVH